jgi:hypothetical protein
MSKPLPNSLPAPAFDDAKHHIRLYHGDCLEILEKIPNPPSMRIRTTEGPAAADFASKAWKSASRVTTTWPC